jgi:hypothetical protein
VHRVRERIVTDLMPALRRLAVDRTANQMMGAKQAIWISYTGLALEADRKLFQDELRKRAIDEEKKARPDLEKLFWRDVGHYAVSLQPRGK